MSVDVNDLPLARALGRIPADRWLTRKEAARFLSGLGYIISAKSLSNMSARDSAGRGPAFHRAGRNIVYLETDLRAWAHSRIKRVE
jgi:hypothetical protein